MDTLCGQTEWQTDKTHYITFLRLHWQVVVNIDRKNTNAIATLYNGKTYVLWVYFPGIDKFK